MIDLRYHIATLIAIFLALGVGILIGSTVVGSDVLVEQQKKIIDQLEGQFEVLRTQGEELSAENRFMSKLLKQYEEFNQAVLPPLIRNRLVDYQVAVIVTGGEEIPSGMLSSLSLAGAKVTSTTIVLPGMSLNDHALKAKLCDFAGVNNDTSSEKLRSLVARNIADIVANKDESNSMSFLQKNNLVKFNGDYSSKIDGVLILGGADNVANYFPETVDAPLIRRLSDLDKKVFGIEVTQVEYSYMQIYQRQKISTVDDIDIIPGQVALILAMEGETGDYGVKPTAKKFMPVLPPEYLEGM